MTGEIRAAMTFGLWFCSALALGALFISAAAQQELTPGHIVLAVAILVLAVAGTPFAWRLTASETEQEKTKRQRIDRLLHNMSDEELDELKQRLLDGDYPEETPLDQLGDDGELLRRN